MDQIFWAVVAWIFLNVIIKLAVNSVERIYKEKIDDLVRKAPGAAKQFIAQVIRWTLVLFFAPMLLSSAFIPTKYRTRNGFSDIFFLRDYLLKRDFHQRATFLFYVMRHPSAFLFDSIGEQHSKYLNK